MADKKSIGEKLKKAVGVKGDFKTAILPMIHYNCNNIFTGGGGYIIGMYFTIFLTDVVNLSLRQAGIIVMIATIWDAVTDPVMGIITDRTKSRFGKHRKYLLISIPMIFVSYTLLWNSFFVDGKTKPAIAMLYFVLVYMLYKTAYTVNCVPHTAMLPELAPDYDLRTQYNSVGYLFNSAGMVPAFGICVLILSLFKSNDEISSKSAAPFLVIGITLSVFFCTGVFLTFRNTKEPSSLGMKTEKVNIRYIISEYVNVFRNKAFRQYFFMAVANQFATGFYGHTKVYYIKYLANQYKHYALFNVVAGVGEASAFPLNYELTIKYGKKKCGDIVTPLMVLGLAIGLFMQPSASPFWVAMMFLSMLIYPFGMSGLGFVTSNIFPDITDVDELITGRRREGTISTFKTLIQKSIGGVMAAFVGFVLEAFGLITGDAAQSIEAQSSTALLGVRICVAVIPIVSAILALILMHQFKMTKENHAMMRAAIATKKKYGTVTLTDEQIKTVELISGQKYENTWLGQGNSREEIHYVETDENGEYTVFSDETEAQEISSEV